MSEPLKFGVPHHDRADRDNDVREGRYTSRSAGADRADRFDDDRGDRRLQSDHDGRTSRGINDHDGQYAVDRGDRGRPSSLDRGRPTSTSSTTRFLDDRADRHEDDRGDRRLPISPRLDRKPSSSQRHHSDDCDRGDRDDRRPPSTRLDQVAPKRHRDNSDDRAAASNIAKSVLGRVKMMTFLTAEHLTSLTKSMTRTANQRRTWWGAQAS
jgi:hypothetical protein